jgi:Mn2+/Fe2+ NRAMP family transporter
VRLVSVFGSGLAVMLADTDVGSIVTAGQSAVQWGYRLLAMQFLLVPILYVMQELAVRLGIFTGRGHGELIRETFGPSWAWVSVVPLAVTTIGTLLTEFSGFAAVGELYGQPRSTSLVLAAAGLLLVVLTGSYRRVERVAIVFGLFELAFFLVAWAAHPDARAVLSGSLDIPYADRDYQYLVAANIGQLVMPWMIFYQQAAVADRRPGSQSRYYLAARLDTALGSFLTQCVMAAVLVACAATFGRSGSHRSLATVGEMSLALTPFLGQTIGTIVFSFGVIGAAMVAAIVCSLAFAWGLGEVAGYRHTLEHHPLQGRWFCTVFASCAIGSAVLVGLWPNLVALNVGIQVINALMLPLVFALLIALAMKRLPREHRLHGAYLWLVLAAASLTCTVGVIGALSGIGLLNMV